VQELQEFGVPARTETGHVAVYVSYGSYDSRRLIYYINGLVSVILGNTVPRVAYLVSNIAGRVMNITDNVIKVDHIP
jgi:hypothetical protein